MNWWIKFSFLAPQVGWPRGRFCTPSRSSRRVWVSASCRGVTCSSCRLHRFLPLPAAPPHYPGGVFWNPLPSKLLALESLWSLLQLETSRFPTIPVSEILTSFVLPIQIVTGIGRCYSLGLTGSSFLWNEDSLFSWQLGRHGIFFLLSNALEKKK